MDFNFDSEFDSETGMPVDDPLSFNIEEATLKVRHDFFRIIQRAQGRNIRQQLMKDINLGRVPFIAGYIQNSDDPVAYTDFVVERIEELREQEQSAI